MTGSAAINPTAIVRWLKVPVVRCLQCRHEWTAFSGRRPRKCPKCQSMEWDNRNGKGRR